MKMPRYTCDTIPDYLKLLRQDIEGALAGKIKGNVANKVDCDALVLEIFDELALQLQATLNGTRMLGSIAKHHGYVINHDTIEEYMRIRKDEILNGTTEAIK